MIMHLSFSLISDTISAFKTKGIPNINSKNPLISSPIKDHTTWFNLSPLLSSLHCTLKKSSHLLAFAPSSILSLLSYLLFTSLWNAQLSPISYISSSYHSVIPSLHHHSLRTPNGSWSTATMFFTVFLFSSTLQKSILNLSYAGAEPWLNSVGANHDRTMNTQI